MCRFPSSSLFYVLALSCGLVAAGSASHKERQLRSDPLSESWEKEEILAILIKDKIEESPTFTPTLSPSKRPTLNPTLSPTEIPSQSSLPSEKPTQIPSQSSQPSKTPTTKPSPNPSAAPSASASPTSSPTSSPTHVPSMAPSTSLSPTAAPSFSLWPSGKPTEKPTISHSPTVTKYTPPTLWPTHSAQPSEHPTEGNATESNMIIDQDKSMTGSATALVVISVFFSILMASGSAYLYRRVASSRGPRRNFLAEALHDLLASPSNEAALEIYLDARNGTAESTETIEYLYTGEEPGSKGSNGEWVDLESMPNGIIELPCPEQSAGDKEKGRQLTVTFSDEDEVISIPAMHSFEMAQEDVIQAATDPQKDSVADNKPKRRKDKRLESLRLPPKIPNFAGTHRAGNQLSSIFTSESLTSLIPRRKITEFDDHISVLSDFASDQLTELIQDVSYIKRQLSQLSSKEESEKRVTDDSCSAGECLQWFAGVSDNASTGSQEREQKMQEEQEANIATIRTFVKQREDENITKKAEALMKRKEDKEKRKRGRSSSKNDKKERNWSSDKKGRLLKWQDH